MSNQLVKRDYLEGYRKVFPKTFIDAIKDRDSGMSLAEILQGFNMYFLSYNGNKALTRCSVPHSLRKEGLWITYVLYDHTVITEWYNSDNIDDESFGSDDNWRQASNMLVGDISVSADGYWVVEGKKTSTKAQGETGVTPLLRFGDNNKLQASYNEGKEWEDISGDITNNLKISKYIGINEALPTSGIAEGTIYMKGPYYDENDTNNDNPIYRMWIYAWKGNTLAWQDNGEFTSIIVGVVQETGNSTTQVMSQDAVTRELTELSVEIDDAGKLLASLPLEIGSISADSGKDTDLATRFKTKGLVAAPFSIVMSSGYYIQYIFRYTPQGEYVDYQSPQSSSKYSAVDDAYKYRLSFKKGFSNDTITENDLDIALAYEGEYAVKIGTKSFTRAYVTGTQDNLIVIDTAAKTVSFPLPGGTLILSEKHGLANPKNTAALDASAYGNNYFILFDFITNKFILAPVNFADDSAYKDCGVVAAVSASQKRVPYINADSYIFNGVSYKKTFVEKEEDDVYGNAFIKKGYYVKSASGEIVTTPNPSATTDFLDIRGVEQIIVKGRSGSAVALVAFYDENKAFISSVFGNDYSKKLITITSAEIPANAHYMVATGVGDGTDFLQITSLNDLYMRLQNMEKSTQPINLSAILTMGASLMYDGNGWVEDGCGILGVTPYNKAASGVGVPSYFADLIWRNAYCTDEEFENADILAIQFASSTNMYIENNTKSIEDYESALDTSAANPFESLSHAECLDYILKKWQKKCYEQKDNPNSKWYGTQYGKPCSLLFVTHWHDGRTNYNETIRQVAAKWGGCVCEFDKKIGFSKNQTLPDGRQPSIIYAVDTQVLDGVTYGWHPLRGDAGKKYIQRKMANIFADTIKECYSLFL